MKSYKTLFIIGCVTIALIVGLIIANVIPENTVDFNGTVTDSSHKLSKTLFGKTDIRTVKSLTYYTDLEKQYGN